MDFPVSLYQRLNTDKCSQKPGGPKFSHGLCKIRSDRSVCGVECKETVEKLFALAEVTRRWVWCALRVPSSRMGRTRWSGLIQPLDPSPSSQHLWVRVVQGPYRLWWVCTLFELGTMFPMPRSRGIGMAMDCWGSDPHITFHSALRAVVSPASTCFVPYRSKQIEIIGWQVLPTFSVTRFSTLLLMATLRIL